MVLNHYEIQNRSVTAHGNQMFGLRHDVAKKIGKSDVATRRLRERPLLLIYFNDGSHKPKDGDEQRILFTSYAVSFQGDLLNPRRTVTRKKLVTAEANVRFEQEKLEEQEEFDYGERDINPWEDLSIEGSLELNTRKFHKSFYWGS